MYDRPKHEVGQVVCVGLAGGAYRKGTVLVYVGRDEWGRDWYRVAISGGQGPKVVEGRRLSPYDEGVCGP